jgi:hypothetical protein
MMKSQAKMAMDRLQMRKWVVMMMKIKMIRKMVRTM